MCCNPLSDAVDYATPALLLQGAISTRGDGQFATTG
jgi:hypothetical protein